MVAMKKKTPIKRFRPTLAEYRTALGKIEALQADRDHQEARFRDCQKAVKYQMQIANDLREQIMQLTAQNTQAANLLEDAYAKTLERADWKQEEITETVKSKGYQVR